MWINKNMELLSDEQLLKFLKYHGSLEKAFSINGDIQLIKESPSPKKPREYRPTHKSPSEIRREQK